VVAAAAVMHVPHMRPAVMVHAALMGVAHAPVVAVVGVVPGAVRVGRAVTVAAHFVMVTPFVTITTVVMMRAVVAATMLVVAVGVSLP